MTPKMEEHCLPSNSGKGRGKCEIAKKETKKLKSKPLSTIRASRVRAVHVEEMFTRT